MLCDYPHNMWLYGSGNDGLPPIRLYDYQLSRGGYHAKEFLKGFSGYLTCDGFGGYNKLKGASCEISVADFPWRAEETLQALVS